MTITVSEISEQVGQRLKQQRQSLATGESCTGGLIGHLLTEVAGSSAYYLGGIVAYSNQVKQQQLAVPQSIIAAFGAVSAETASAMAEGAQAALAADIGVATTGIAGPGGGTPTKPVGLVYIAVATATVTECRRYVFQGDRHAIKQQTAVTALRLLLEVLH